MNMNLTVIEREGRRNGFDSQDISFPSGIHAHGALMGNIRGDALNLVYENIGARGRARLHMLRISQIALPLVLEVTALEGYFYRPNWFW